MPANDPFHQDRQDEFKARITALLLGEYDGSVAAELREAIDADPELIKLRDRLEKTIGLLGESGKPAESLPLDEERRAALFESFKQPIPEAKKDVIEDLVEDEFEGEDEDEVERPPTNVRPASIHRLLKWTRPIGLAASLVGLLTVAAVSFITVTRQEWATVQVTAEMASDSRDREETMLSENSEPLLEAVRQQRTVEDISVTNGTFADVDTRTVDRFYRSGAAANRQQAAAGNPRKMRHITLPNAAKPADEPNDKGMAPEVAAFGLNMQNDEFAFGSAPTDSEMAADNLTFSLGNGAPEGAQIDRRNGLFAWDADAKKRSSVSQTRLLDESKETPGNATEEKPNATSAKYNKPLVREAKSGDRGRKREAMRKEELAAVTDNWNADREIKGDSPPSPKPDLVAPATFAIAQRAENWNFRERADAEVNSLQTPAAGPALDDLRPFNPPAAPSEAAASDAPHSPQLNLVWESEQEVRRIGVAAESRLINNLEATLEQEIPTEAVEFQTRGFTTSDDAAFGVIAVVRTNGSPGGVAGEVDASNKAGSSSGVHYLFSSGIFNSRDGKAAPIEFQVPLNITDGAEDSSRSVNLRLTNPPAVSVSNPNSEAFRQSKLPVLGDAPMIGRLFQSEAKGAQELAELRTKASEQEPPTPPAKPARTPTPRAKSNPEIQAKDNPFSTFSLNVSDVSFKLAAASLEKGALPDPATIRSEEFVNAFDYRDPAPTGEARLAFAFEQARDPFAHNRDLMRFAVQTAAVGREPGRPLNLVVALDNSGSMERADRVAIVRQALRVLSGQLTAADRVSVVAFARTPRLWVDGLPGDRSEELLSRVLNLNPEGGTNLEAALDAAYATAQKHFREQGNNRVILLTDGAANLGDIDPAALKQKVESFRAKGVALDCFGIGWDGYNDDLMESLSRNGDGRYGFLNDPQSVAAEFADQLAVALRVAASNVKAQIEFNPARVVSWRQIGYEKHQLKKEQFRDNKVDAAEIGAAESGTALYSIQTNPNGSGPIGVARIRFMDPATGRYEEQSWPLPYNRDTPSLEKAAPSMRLAVCAAAFAEWLAQSPYAAEVTPDALLGYLNEAVESYALDARPRRLQSMIQQARQTGGQ